MTDFGKLLRTFREQCHNPGKGGKLSQQWLGRLLGEEMGISFSGATVSYWESGESKIHADDRFLLISLLKVLYKNEGLKTLSDAETLLEAGNYRALNPDEKLLIFPKEALEKTSNQPLAINIKEQTPQTDFLLGSIFFNSPEEFQKIWGDAKEGPPPVWPRVVTAFLRKISDQISNRNTFHTLLWLWVWIASFILVTPVLQWPFPNQETASASIIKYIGSSILVPICIGILTYRKDNPFWRHNEAASSRMILLYTYQGAFIGFHLGYFAIFAICLLMFFLQINLVSWVQFILAGFPLLMGYISAQVVPYNLWRAYGRLWFSDGAIFFVFILLGPVWGWFFFEFYSLLISSTTGIIVILAAITLLVSLMTLQYQRKGNTTFPVHWWIILYSLILICQIILLFIK